MFTGRVASRLPGLELQLLKKAALSLAAKRHHTQGMFSSEVKGRLKAAVLSLAAHAAPASAAAGGSRSERGAQHAQQAVQRDAVQAWLKALQAELRSCVTTAEQDRLWLSEREACRGGTHDRRYQAAAGVTGIRQEQGQPQGKHPHVREVAAVQARLQYKLLLQQAVDLLQAALSGA